MDPRDAGPGDEPPEPSPDTPWSREGREEAEPDWARQIREGRQEDRGPYDREAE
jgi:hypothetical protein